MSGNGDDLFIGFDFSTQQLKATVLDDKLNLVFEESVIFDQELPEFRTQGGVNKHGRTGVVTCNPIMWVKSLDLIMDKLKITGCDLYNVKCISGSAQQHGTVYWKKGARDILSNLDSSKFLHTQLQLAFALRDTPTWQDSSTLEQCESIEEQIGGAFELAKITGSRAYTRYSACQILKIFKESPHIYEQTERISLISSFAASLFLGNYAPIDFSDGSGMNLLDIKTKKWHEKLLSITADEHLETKLGQPVDSTDIIGNISKFFVERYGFNEECKITAFTGDNPSSLAGMCLNESDIAVSLGTSDTVIMWLKNATPTLNSHILINPIDSNDYLGLVCFKNGSQTRERISRENAESNWDLFAELLESTPRGNFGNLGLYFDLNEIYPVISGDFRYNKFNEQVARFSKEVEVRACIESQFIRLRAHAENLGFECPPYNQNKEVRPRIFATGGASKNNSLLCVLSDVFNLPVYVQSKPNSAALGSCLIAKFALNKDKMTFNEMVSNFSNFTQAAKPSADADTIYTKLTKRYREIEDKLDQLAKEIAKNKNQQIVN